MDTFTEIEHLGFYPALVTGALRRAFGGGAPCATMWQLDAAFDRETMFRHLTVVALGTEDLVQLHVDELDDGGAMVATHLTHLSQVRNLSMIEVMDDPTSGAGTVVEVTISLDTGSQRRTEVEPLHCDDPECVADHGYAATTEPDDLSMRFSREASGEGDVERAERFFDALTAALRALR